MRTATKFPGLGGALAVLPVTAIAHPGHGVGRALAHDWQHVAWLVAGALLAASLAWARRRGGSAQPRRPAGRR